MFKGKLQHIVQRIHYKNIAVTRNLTNHSDISVDQLRAARSLLNWSQAELSKRSGYALATINNIERGQYQAHSATLNNIVQTFEEAGIQFIDGPGVRLQAVSFQIKYYEGTDALGFLFQKIVASLKNGGDLYMCGIDENALKTVGSNEALLLKDGLKDNVKVHILSHKSLSAGLTFCNTRKKVVAENVPLTPFFIYNGRVALVILKNPTHVAIIYNDDLFEHYKAQFEYIWNKEKAL